MFRVQSSDAHLSHFWKHHLKTPLDLIFLRLLRVHDTDARRSFRKELVRAVMGV